MVRAVLAGCGAMSAAWLEAARDLGVAIAGLVDIDADRARVRAVEFGLDDAATGADLDAVLAQTRPDVVFDVAVPAVRREIALTALDHGCHLLTERPLAASLEDGRAIVAAAREAGRLHAVIQNRRFLAAPRRIRRFLASGAIGTPTSIHCDFFLGPHFGGFREEMRHVLLLDMAIHTFVSARYLVDRLPVAVFEGVVFTYIGSWCADGLRTSWENAWRVVATRGSLTWDGSEKIAAELRGSGRDGLFDRTETIVVPPLDPRDRVGGHRGVIGDFLDAVRDGTEPETRGADNIRSLAMVFGAIESAETGRQVPIDA